MNISNAAKAQAPVDSAPSMEVDQPSTTVPTGMMITSLSYSFKRYENTDDNRSKKLVFGELISNHTIESATFAPMPEGAEKGTEPVQLSKEMFKRNTEQYSVLVPLVSTLGFTLDEESAESVAQGQCLQRMVADAVDILGRVLVDNGIVITQENCCWEQAVKYLNEKAANQRTSSGIAKEVLEAACKSFEVYLKQIGKPANGIEVMVKMLKSQFSAASTAKYMQGLPIVQENMVNWVSEGCTEQEQELFSTVAVKMVEKIDGLLKPVVVEDMF